MTKQQATEWWRSHEDNDELDDEDLEAAFAALYERPADDCDRQNGLWSLVCAAEVAQIAPLNKHAQSLGRLGRGIKKRLSVEEIERKRERLTIHRLKRWPKSEKGDV